MAKKYTDEEINDLVKRTGKTQQELFDTCVVCGELELKGSMLLINPNSNCSKVMCTECNESVNSINDLYTYPYNTNKVQFTSPSDHNFKVGEKVTRRKNVYVIQTQTYHEILRDYRNIQFKIGTNINKGDKEFKTYKQAEDFAKLISSTNTYASYYVVENENEKFYVISTDEHNTNDIGTIISKEFFDYK